MCGEWWEQSLKERGKKRVYRFQGWPVKKCFQCCQTEKTAASVKELLSASFSFIYCPDFFSKQKKQFFFSWNFFQFHSWGKCVFIIILWFFFFFFQSLSHITFLCFFLVRKWVERNSQKNKKIKIIFPPKFFFFLPIFFSLGNFNFSCDLKRKKCTWCMYVHTWTFLLWLLFFIRWRWKIFWTSKDSLSKKVETSSRVINTGQKIIDRIRS